MTIPKGSQTKAVQAMFDTMGCFTCFPPRRLWKAYFFLAPFAGPFFGAALACFPEAAVLACFPAGAFESGAS